MSNQTNIRDALLSNGVEAIGLSYPIKWPNAPFTTPSNGATWLRVTPLYATPRQVGLRELDRVDGVLQIDIFVKKDTGDSVANAIADELRQAMPNNGGAWSSGGINVRFVSAGLRGSPQDDGIWSKFMFEAQFYAFVDRRD